MLLAVGVLAENVSTTWEDMRREAALARGDESRIAQRWLDGSDLKQALFRSLTDQSLAGSPPTTPEETVSLIRHLRLQLFDFRLAASKDVARAIAICRSSLESGDRKEATKLWEQLLSVCSERRQFGGMLDLPELLQLLQEFRLKDHPDYYADWDRVRAHSREISDPVKTSVGQVASLTRCKTASAIKTHLTRHPATVVIGESGTGKSAIVKQVTSSAKDTVWLAAEDFDSDRSPSLQAGLGLQHDLADLLKASRRHPNYLIIDSAERLSSNGLHRCAQLLATVLRSSSAAWKIVVTTQPDRWEDKGVLCGYASRGH